VVNPYTVKELKCMAMGQFSCAQAEGAQLSSALESHSASCRLSIHIRLFFRQKMMRMKINASEKAASPLSFSHSSAPLPLRCSGRDFFRVFGVMVGSHFPLSGP